MDPISNTDRLVRLLRQKLEERAKTGRAKGAKAAAPVALKGMEKVRSVTGRLAREGVDDEQLQRALVEQLLADQFGAAMVNEPKFQQIIDRVCQMMKSDQEIALVLEQTATGLRQKGL